MNGTTTTLEMGMTETAAATRLRPALDYAPGFRRRRAINWLTLGLTYSGMYMGRYNLSFANKALSDTFHWDKTQIGTIITAGLTVYGFSAILNGPLADKIGGRRSMILGASGTVLFNFLFGLGAYLGFIGTGTWLLGYFATIWALNSYFQSFSALSLIKVNAGWFHITERGVFSAIFGSMIQGGRLLIFAIAPLLVAVLPWQWLFFVPSAIVAFMAFMSYLNVRNAPEDCGLPAIDVEDASSGDPEKVSLGYVLRKVFTNPVTLMIATAEFCTGFARHGFEQWFPRYMIEAQKMSLSSGVFQRDALIVVAAGIVGAFCAGTLSDWIFKGRRAPMAAIGYLLQIGSLAVIWQAPGIEMVITAFVVNSFAISIVHSMLTGTASMDFGGKKAAATAAGLFDGMQYLGGAFTGVGLGFLLDRFGWAAWGPGMIIFPTIGGILMLCLWNARPKTAKAAH